MTRKLAFISLISLLLSCKTEYHKVVEVYPNGKPKIEYVYWDKNDTSRYTYNSYFDNGKLMFSSKIVNEKFTNEKITYYSNGQIKRIEKLDKPVAFDDSLYDCEVINYWKNGKPESKYTFKNNLLEGTAYYYDSLGNLGRKDDYANGKLNGKEIHYYSTGQIKELVNVKNDSAYGFEYYFDEKGDTTKAFVHYGLSVDGIFYKKWLANGITLTGSYGDSNRSFFIWKWYDKNKTEIKKLVDKGNNGEFIAPE